MSDECEFSCSVVEAGDRIDEKIKSLQNLLEDRKCELKSKLESFKTQTGDSEGKFSEVKLAWRDGELRDLINSLGNIEFVDKETGIPDTTCPIPDTICPIPDTTCPIPDTTCPIPDTTCPIPEPLEASTYVTMSPIDKQTNPIVNNNSEDIIAMKTVTEDVESTSEATINTSLPATILDEEKDYETMNPIMGAEAPVTDIDTDLYWYSTAKERSVGDDIYDVIDESKLGDLSLYEEYTRRISAKLSGSPQKQALAKKEKATPLLDLPVVATCTLGKKLGQLNKPKGIALSQKGDIFVAEKGNNRVQVFNSMGNKLYSIGADRMSGPYGVLVLGDFVYVTLTNVHVLQMYAIGGEFVKQKGKEGREEGKLKHPTGLDGDEGRGKIFICDTDNNRIQIFDTHLRFLKVFKTVKLDKPLEVKVVKFSALVVLDRSPKCVHFISSTGEVMKEIVDTERYPMVLNPLYMTLSLEGNILLSDFSKHCIHVFSEEGKPLWKIGQEGKGKTFDEPRGIACDAYGRLVTVCNKNKNMLQIFEI